MRRKHTSNRLTAPLALCALFLVSASPAQSDSLKRFEALDLSKHRLAKKDIQPLLDHDTKAFNPEFDSELKLPLLRGLVFAKYGRVFKEPEVQAYLKTLRWYKPNPKFSNDLLTPIDRQNLDLIRGAEAESHGDRVLPGDLRWWQTKKIPFEVHGWYSLNDTRIMRAEIEAIHGKVFASEPLLQKYFSERYWYKPDPAYSPSRLSPIEQANLKTLQRYEAKNGVQFTPFVMIRYDAKLIPPKGIEALSLYELRLARNGLYAMRGKRFTTPWLREFFENLEWYEPLADQSKVALTKIDDKNLAAILKVERARREALSTKPLKQEELAGLFVEDLRKLVRELPARHGKVFADKSLQSYFAAQPWYKPNPKYRDSMLSKIERRNQQIIEATLQRTHKQFLFEEG